MINHRMVCDERIPLEVDSRNYGRNATYSTFPKPVQKGTNKNFPKWWDLISVTQSSKLSHSGRWYLEVSLKMLAAFCAFAIAWFYNWNRRGGYFYYSEAESFWDHNFYRPRYETRTSDLLLAQTAPKRNQNALDIASKPNRAYARQWGRDYVQYTPPRPQEFCSAYAHVLEMVLALHYDEVPPYENVLLLRADAVIIDMDYDLKALIPPDRLVSIVTSQSSAGDEPGALFFNLRHDLIGNVSDAWMRALHSTSVTECDAIDETQLLLQVIQENLGDDEEIFDLVQQLNVIDQGLLGGPFPVIKLNSDRESSRMRTLQATADSVCYRYYPKCEIV